MKNNKFYHYYYYRNKPSSLDCSDSNSINYDINQCGENNIINKLDDLDTDSDTIEYDVFFINIFGD